MPEVNYLAVVVAAVAAFLLGAVWYSPILFVKPWMAENHFTNEELKSTSRSMGMMYGIAVVSSLLSSFAMAVLLITPVHHSLEIGLKRGFAAGVCWVAMCFAATYAFEQRSARLWAINAGYYVAQFTIMGAVLGVMNS